LIKNNPKIVLAIFSIIIGLFISAQMKLNLESFMPVTLRSIQDTRKQIELLNNEIKEYDQIIKQKEDELEVLENIDKNNESIIDLLAKNVEDSKALAGRISFQGPGIEITMYDNLQNSNTSYDINDEIIHDVDILNVLNDLRNAGAEAISINDQRVLANSEIFCRGPVIMVNGKSIATPFVVKAIGEPKVLMASVYAPGTYGDILKTVYEIGFEPQIKDRVLIPAYKGNFSYKFAKDTEKGD